MELLRPEKLLEESVLEIRGDGKAGGGLVLAMQSFAGLLLQDESLFVQEWPFFSSARKGAAIRSFLRASRKPIHIASEVMHPQVTVLMDDGAAKFVDFAEGVPHGGVFVVNTKHTPEEVAKHYHLSGTVIAINGDELGAKYLKTPMSNISIYASLVKAIPSLSPAKGLDVLTHVLEKRRLPKPLVKANGELFNASLSEAKTGVFDYARPGDHELQKFGGYGDLPHAAQTGLRISLSNKTSSYARTGTRVSFADPNLACTGCSACIINCPENIITHQPDEKRSILVTGADFGGYCKACRECVESCPQELFIEKPYEEVWEEI